MTIVDDLSCRNWFIRNRKNRYSKSQTTIQYIFNAPYTFLQTLAYIAGLRYHRIVAAAIMYVCISRKLIAELISVQNTWYIAGSCGQRPSLRLGLVTQILIFLG
jgi:hypothetical protein